MFIVVLHQTEESSDVFLSTIQTASYSYHAFISTNGALTYLVPANRAAVACGNCELKGISNVDANSYQICLESIDGSLNSAQYMTLAYLLSQLDIALDKVYTHADLSSSSDLKKLDRVELFRAYNKFLPNKTIYTGLE